MNRKLQSKLIWGWLQTLHRRIFLIGTLASSVLVSACFAQAAQGGAGAAGSQPTVSSPMPSTKPAPAVKPALPKPSPRKPSPFHGAEIPSREKKYYQLTWGADSFAVKWAEQGEMIRFTYHVVDPDKAKPLNNKENEPYLVDPAAHVKLVIPELEKVGKLRQSAPPEAGKIYWMAFSNKGRYVKRGDRVNVTIGKFHVDGLIVE